MSSSLKEGLDSADFRSQLLPLATGRVGKGRVYKAWSDQAHVNKTWVALEVFQRSPTVLYNVMYSRNGPSSVTSWTVAEHLESTASIRTGSSAPTFEGNPAVRYPRLLPLASEYVRSKAVSMEIPPGD